MASAFVPKWSATPVPTDAAGRPLAPEFNSVGDVNTGLLQTPYNLTDQLDPSGMNAVRTEAMRDPGTMSRWGQLALGQAKDANARTNAGATTTAMNNLAMSGGLRGGQRERIQTAGAQNTLRANQNSTAQIQTQDELNRQKWMAMLPGMDLQAAQYKTGLQDRNVGRALTEVNAGRSMQQQQFNEGMRAWGADKTAAAAAASSGGSGGLFNDDIPLIGGCFLTTAAVGAMGLADDCWVLELARKFRDTYMTENESRAGEILFYYKVAPKIVEKINLRKDSKKVWKRIFWKHIVPFVKEVKAGSNEKAHALYKRMIQSAEGLAG